MQEATQRSTIRTVAMTALAVLFIGSCSNLMLESEKIDEQFVQTDKSNLSLGLAPGDTLSSITKNITVPDSIEEGTTISWASSDPDTVAVNGTVTRPTFDAGNRTVTLTATLVTGTASATKTFSLVIIPVDPTDAEAVASATTALAIGYATGDSAAGIRQNLSLPATGLWGTSVSWLRTAGTAIDPADGTVTRPAYLAGNTSVSLQATLTKNAASNTKDFNGLVVVRLAGTDAECVAEDKASLAIGYAAGDSAASVTQAITLATTGSNETTISWSSYNAAIASNGSVTRPAYTAGNATVTLTATITKAGSSEIKTFTLTVPCLGQTDAEAVADGKASLAITYGGSDTATSVTVNLASLPATSTSATAVSWATNDAAHVTAAGVVTRPVYGSSDATVTLTATITKGSATATKTFTLTVKEQPDPDQIAVDAAWDVLTITYAADDSATSVTQSVTLPTTGASGTTVTWASSNNMYINSAGTLNFRNVNQDDPVTLTAIITKGSRSRDKTFTLTVIRWPAGVPSWANVTQDQRDIGLGGGSTFTVIITDARGTYCPNVQVNFSRGGFATGYFLVQKTEFPATDGYNSVRTTNSMGYTVEIYVAVASDPTNTDLTIWIGLPAPLATQTWTVRRLP